LFEKIPERTATINDGTGTLWTTKYTYTDFGEAATRTDARGVITTYTYDALNRLTNVSYNTTDAPGVAATPSVTYTYDNNQTSPTRGLLLSVAVGSNYTKSLNYAVNSGNGGANIILASVTYTIEGKTYPVSFQYNQANQRTQLTFPSGRKLNINYDSKGRLLSLVNNSDSSNYLGGLTYNYSGFRTGWSLGNGVAETFTHDANRVFLASQTAVKNGNTLLSLNYNYQAAAGNNGAGTTAGNAHQLISITGSIGGLSESANYSYDLQKRLVRSSRTTNGASIQRQFAYDRWGNRTQVLDPISGDTQTMILQTAGGAPTNRIATIQQIEMKANKTNLYEYNYSYDAAGNVTNDGVHAYTYDAENRLVSVDGGVAAQYSYDDQNRRVKKSGMAANTHYIWNGSKIIAEHNGSTSAVNIEYVHYEDKLVAKEQGGRFFFLNDKLSVRAVLDSNGNIIGRQAHLPFGEEIAASGMQEKHHLTGYESDVESSTDYAVNRQYSQSTGRFLSADPYEASAGANDPQSWNRYTYVLNDPIHNTDALGLLMAPPVEEGGCGAIGIGDPLQGKLDPPEIRLKQVEILEQVKKYEFSQDTVQFNFRNSMVCDGEEFALTLSFSVFQTDATWNVLTVEMVGELLRIGDPQKSEAGEFGKQIKVRLRWDNKDEVTERKSSVTIKLEATRSNIYGPSRSAASAHVRMKCTN
jgi:RHS repeat-associated protein